MTLTTVTTALSTGWTATEPDIYIEEQNTIHEIGGTMLHESAGLVSRRRRYKARFHGANVDSTLTALKGHANPLEVSYEYRGKSIAGTLMWDLIITEHNTE